MCGIVGIVGKEYAEKVILSGLERLEYRGYDSAGLYVANKKEDYLIKSLGRIKNLEEKVDTEINGTIGIGHTRWATHGKPSEKNAHPHTSPDRRLVLVHNGVIENFEELQQNYLSNDHFDGQTDTEIVVHLIATLMEQENLTTKAAFKKTLSLLRGSYAFALIDRQDKDTIYVAKNKSPLLIGLGTGFNVICSDAMAMLDQTSHFVEIADGEMVTITANAIHIEDTKGQVIFRKPYEAQLDLTDIEKGAYPFYMLKEIDEQPAVMRRLITEYSKAHEVVLDQRLLQEISGSDRLYIIACGTSYNAGCAAKKLFETMTQIPAEVHLSSEFSYNMPLLSERPFFIFLSQSGETADSRQVLVQITQMGHPTLTITNVAGSTLSREADHTLLLYAGPEIAVASTKAYTAQIAVLGILAQAVGKNKQVPSALAFDIFHELSIVATAMETMINQKDLLAQIAKDHLATTRNAFYIGRGIDYSVSCEAALKLKEISYIQTEGFASGELKHGTIALIENGTPVFGIITDANSGSHTRGNLKEVESRGADTVVLASASLANEADAIILPEVHPLLTSLVSVIPTQLIAYFACLERGLDVDKPRNLAKSVTVE